MTSFVRLASVLTPSQSVHPNPAPQLVSALLQITGCYVVATCPTAQKGVSEARPLRVSLIAHRVCQYISAHPLVFVCCRDDFLFLFGGDGIFLCSPKP